MGVDEVSYVHNSIIYTLIHFIVYHKIYGKRKKRSENLKYIGSTGSIYYTSSLPAEKIFTIL